MLTVGSRDFSGAGNAGSGPNPDEGASAAVATQAMAIDAMAAHAAKRGTQKADAERLPWRMNVLNVMPTRAP
jgi:hypothetical protein